MTTEPDIYVGVSPDGKMRVSTLDEGNESPDISAMIVEWIEEGLIVQKMSLGQYSMLPDINSN